MKKLIKNIATNWKSGLSIAVVSVPLSISFAIASGGTPIMGLITSAWAGIVAALIGGSNFNVISPAGAFAGILTVIALNFGIEAIPIVTIIGGLFMLLGYFFNVQRFLTFIPGGAIFGFTLGIAAIISGTQINSALGLNNLTQHESLIENILESFRNITELDPAAALVFGIFLVALIILAKVFKKIPSIILVTPLGIILGWLVSTKNLGFSLMTLGSTYGNLQTQLFDMPNLTAFDWNLIVPAITIAVVGILETMLSAKIAGKATNTRYNERKEMFGLSLANLMSGFVGGMPATGVLGPTMLNIRTGAKGRASAALKAIFVALITLLFFSLFKFIPMPVIAATLFFVAISMVETKRFLLYYKHDKYALLIGLLVAGITLYKDPALGILVGSAIGLLIFAEKVSRGSYDATHNSSDSDKKIHIAGEKKFSTHANYDILVYSIQGVLSHLTIESHLARLEEINSNITTIILRLRGVSYMDMEGAEGLDALVDMLTKKNITVLITGTNNYLEKTLLQHSHHYKTLKENEGVFKKTRYALETLGVPPASKEELL
jgi:SulP family sulfate permease